MLQERPGTDSQAGHARYGYIIFQRMALSGFVWPLAVKDTVTASLKLVFYCQVDGLPHVHFRYCGRSYVGLMH